MIDGNLDKNPNKFEHSEGVSAYEIGRRLKIEDAQKLGIIRDEGANVLDFSHIQNCAICTNNLNPKEGIRYLFLNTPLPAGYIDTFNCLTLENGKLTPGKVSTQDIIEDTDLVVLVSR